MWEPGPCPGSLIAQGVEGGRRDEDIRLQNMPTKQPPGLKKGEVGLTCGTAPPDRGRGAGGEGFAGREEEEQEEEGCSGRAGSGSGFIQARCWQTPCGEVELL